MTYPQTHAHRWTWRRALALPLIGLIRLYQLVISPMTPPSCRFYPSCSAYALTALERHGPLTGTWLALRRVGRCNPWNPGGVDHVPQKVPAGAAAHAHPVSSVGKDDPCTTSS